MGSVVVAPRFKSTASVVVAHRLSCSVACGIFPNQGWNLCSLHGQADYLPLSHQRSSKNFDYNFCILFKKLLSVSWFGGRFIKNKPLFEALTLHRVVDMVETQYFMLSPVRERF